MGFHIVFAFLRWSAGRLGAERGQTMTEYAVLIAFIVLLVIVAATKLGASIGHAFSSTASRV